LIAHNVYFSLKDNSGAARQSLIDACRKYLSIQPGMVSFYCGVLAADHIRSVNVQDFDVGLHVVFVDKEAHDIYHNSVEHDRFVEEMSDNWATSRVFDTIVA
jgi:hypothetical protein